jgi:integrase
MQPLTGVRTEAPESGVVPKVYFLIFQIYNSEMPENPHDRLDRLHAAIESANDLPERDRELLLRFDDRITLQQYSAQRREKLLRHCKILAGVTDTDSGGAPDDTPDVSLGAVLEDEAAARTMARWINRTYDNEETNRDYRIALRVFAKHITDGDEVPDSVAWVPSGTSRSYDPTPDPAKMLEWEADIRPMLEATLNTRDAALITVAWDAAARSGELLDLRVGDVTDHDYGLQLSVDGKQGQRAITLIPSVPYLTRWLEDHPRRDDDTAPLWCTLQDGAELSYQMCRKISREAAERADVTKPVTFTNFRKSSASYLASQGVNQAVLEDHHGWTTGSDVASRYVSVFADASDRALARVHGKDIKEDEPDPIAAITCPRCEKETPREESFCMWCNQAIEPGAVDAMEEKEATQRRELLAAAKEHPELLGRLEEMEPLIEAVGGDPDVIETARRFVEEAND